MLATRETIEAPDQIVALGPLSMRAADLNDVMQHCCSAVDVINRGSQLEVMHASKYPTVVGQVSRCDCSAQILCAVCYVIPGLSTTRT